MVAPDDPGDDLGRRLGAALSDLASTQVDSRALLEGSARRAQHVRTRRVVTAGVAAALLVAVPFGYEVINQPEESPPVAAMVPTTRPAYPAASIPDRYRTDPGHGLSLTDDDPAAGQPVVQGESCTWGSRASAGPRASRTWTYADDGADGVDGTELTVTVTGWAAGGAERALAGLTSTNGPCRWDASQQPVGGLEPLGDQSWAATSTGSGRSFTRVVVRRAALVVGVQVRSATGDNGVLPLARLVAKNTVAKFPGR